MNKILFPDSHFFPEKILPLSNRGGVRRCRDILRVNRCLEDHPMTCKWSITMVIVSSLSGVVGPLPNGLNGL